MSKHCAIQEFLDGADDLVVSLHTSRYGRGIIAIVTYPDMVGKVVDTFEDNNGESELDLWGLRDSWYPFAEGESVSEALNGLRIRLNSTRSNWSLIRHGLQGISNDLPPSNVNARFKCKVITFEALAEAQYEWNHGGDTIRFF